jgi:hypothetical protein
VAIQAAYRRYAVADSCTLRQAAAKIDEVMDTKSGTADGDADSATQAKSV